MKVDGSLDLKDGAVTPGSTVGDITPQLNSEKTVATAIVVPVNIPQDNVVDLGTLKVTQQSRQDVSLVMSIDESLIELDEDGGGGLSQDVSSMVIWLSKA